MRLTKKVHKHFSVAKIAIALIVTCGLTNQVLAQDDKLVLQITTKLGAQVQINIHKADVSSNLPQSLYTVLHEVAHGGYFPHEYNYIVLEQGNGLFVLIHWQIFKSAVISDNLHVVTLKDGTEYSGKLLTTVESKSDAGLVKTYDLASLNKIDLVSIAPLPEKKMKEAKRSGQSWILSISKPNAQSFEVLAPHFTFPYQHSGFANQIYTDVYKTDAFYLRVKEEDIPANLSDFESVEFQEKNLMTVIGVGGQKTSGTLKLIASTDGKVSQPMDGRWMLVSETKNGCLLVLEAPIGKITKVAQSKQEVAQQSTSESQPKTKSTKPDTSKAIPTRAVKVDSVSKQPPIKLAPKSKLKLSLDGEWNGTTSQGNPINFTVRDHGISFISFTLVSDNFSNRSSFMPLPSLPINENEFSVMSSSGATIIKGMFSSDISASGTIGTGSDKGTWEAKKKKAQ